MSIREQQIASMTASGMPQQAIADNLGISIKTVDTYRASLYRKHGLHSIADLTRWWLMEGSHENN